MASVYQKNAKILGMDLLTVLIVILIAVMLGVFTLVYRVWNTLQQPPLPPPPPDTSSFLLLQNQMKNLENAVSVPFPAVIATPDDATGVVVV